MTIASAVPSRQPLKQNLPGITARNAKPAPLLERVSAAEDDEFRMNLHDLPRMSTGLKVDGFEHSLISRALDLIDRLRTR